MKTILLRIEEKEYEELKRVQAYMRLMGVQKTIEQLAQDNYRKGIHETLLNINNLEL